MDYAPVPMSRRIPVSEVVGRIARVAIVAGAGVVMAVQLTAPVGAANLALGITTIVTVLALLAGVLLYHPPHAGVWYGFAAGIVLCMGGGGFFLVPGADGSVERVLAGCVLLVAGFVLLAGAMLGMGRYRKPKRSRTGLLDMLLVVAATAVPALQIAAVPLLRRFEAFPGSHHSEPLSITVILVLNPLLMIVVLVLLGRLLLLPGRRPTALWLLVASLSATLISDLMAADSIGPSGLHFGSFSIGWTAGLALDALAALHPSMVELTMPAPLGERDLDRTTTWIFTGILTAGPTALLVARLAGEPVQLSLGLGAVVATSLLLLVRLRWLFREKENAETASSGRERWFRSLVQNIADIIVVTNARGIVQYSSPSTVTALGYGKEALGSRSALHMVHPDDRRRALSLFSRTLSATGGMLVEELRVKDARGRWRWFRVAGADVDGPEGELGVVVTLHDVTERRVLVEELRHRAFYDTLTGLANRALLTERVDRALAQRGACDSPVAVLFLDLDNFKNVNDSLGHAAGDELLRAVARRISSAVRPEDTVARLGGDEFVVLLDQGAEPEYVADRAIETLQLPLTIVGRQISVTASIGIAVGLGTTADALLRDADVALYHAKAAGKACWARFEEPMRSLAEENFELATDLRHALESGEIGLDFQPVYSLTERRLVGAEALLRWIHPRWGSVAPERAIALAENSGLIGSLGQWIIDHATATVASWRLEAENPIWVAVNVSPKQLDDDALVSGVAEALGRSGLPPSALLLELTEHAVARDVERATRRLEALAALGVRIAVDDFGTGYSSLASLGSLPLHVLKIDRSFVAQLGTTPSAAPLVRTVVELAGALGLCTIAEGVETLEQLERLCAEGCDLVQGYLLGMPSPDLSEGTFFEVAPKVFGIGSPGLT